MIYILTVALAAFVAHAHSVSLYDSGRKKRYYVVVTLLFVIYTGILSLQLIPLLSPQVHLCLLLIGITLAMVILWKK